MKRYVFVTVDGRKVKNAGLVKRRAMEALIFNSTCEQRAELVDQLRAGVISKISKIN